MSVATEKGRRAHRFGKDGEEFVYRWLVSFGIKCNKQSYTSPYDIDCSGVRIEVKTSQSIQQRGKTTWQFNLHRHGVLNENCDFYIFRLENVPEFEAAVHLVIPAPLRAPTIHITFRSLMVRWGKFYNNLEPLQIAIEQKAAVA